MTSFLPDDRQKNRGKDSLYPRLKTKIGREVRAGQALPTLGLLLI